MRRVIHGWRRAADFDPGISWRWQEIMTARAMPPNAADDRDD
jgi:hypothetical protein